jgi:hypothetical protein
VVGKSAENPRPRRNAQEKPMSHDGRRSRGSPDRAASLGSLGPHARPCPDDRHATAVGSFRNNSVLEDESHAKLRSNPAQRRDHHQELTDKIIVALEASTAPWGRPWDKTACGGAAAPINAATGHRYRGINLSIGVEHCPRIIFPRRITPSMRSRSRKSGATAARRRRTASSSAPADTAKRAPITTPSTARNLA